MTTALAEAPKAQGTSLIATLAGQYGLAPKAFEETIRKTVMPSATTNEEFCAFLLVAHKYNLNPITREIYAFPKKGGGIQPIVGVDGWMNLVNSHPAFDGVEFEDDWGKDGDAKAHLKSVTCKMYRKDRSRPIVVTEYLSECRRDTEPWRNWPSRMLRHKAYIQCARVAFGFSGIVDEDEFERQVVSVAQERKAVERAALNIEDLKPADPAAHVAVSEPTGPVKAAEPAAAPVPEAATEPAKVEAPATTPAAEVLPPKPPRGRKALTTPTAEPAPAAAPAPAAEPTVDHWTGSIATVLSIGQGKHKATSKDNDVFYTDDAKVAEFLKASIQKYDVGITYTEKDGRWHIVKAENI